MDLVLGTAQLTRAYGVLDKTRGPRTNKAYQRLVTLAQGLGFSAIDTAPSYGDAETVLGSVDSNLYIHTKFDEGLSEEDSVRQSLRRLRRDSLEVVYFHQRLDQVDFAERVPDTRKRLSPEVVRHLGVSVYEPEECRRAMRSQAITAIQFPYNVFDRRFRPEFFSDFIGRGGRVFVRSVFLQGLLLMEPELLPRSVIRLAPFLASLRDVCREYEVDPLRAAVWFVHRNFPFGSLILGTRSVRELGQIGDALAGDLPDEFIKALEDLGQPEWAIVDPRNW